MTVQDYLDQHYWTTDELAERSGLSMSELNAMIADGLVPKPSYVVRDAVLQSAAFGDLDADGTRCGAYFHPASLNWIARAQNFSSDQNAATLKIIFNDNMAAELSVLNRDVWRLDDAFDDQGKPHPEGLQARIDSYWDAFLEGIFGLCVANPLSEREIAYKEILQEKLTALTDNGSKFVDINISREDLLKLIQDYANASMPFSPVEYPISSRKRLVDELRGKCAAAQ